MSTRGLDVGQEAKRSAIQWGVPGLLGLLAVTAISGYWWLPEPPRETYVLLGLGVATLAGAWIRLRAQAARIKSLEVPPPAMVSMHGLLFDEHWKPRCPQCHSPNLTLDQQYESLDRGSLLCHCCRRFFPVLDDANGRMPMNEARGLLQVIAGMPPRARWASATAPPGSPPSAGQPSR